MSLSRSSTSSVLPSFIAAAILLGIGAAVANLGYAPAWWQLLVLVVCAGLAAAALIVPALRAQRQADATRAEREARVSSLAEGIDAALAKLHAATAEAQLLTEQNLRHQSLADELTAKLNAVADNALEKISAAARDAAEQSVQAAARSVQSVEQAAQPAAQAAALSAAATIAQASSEAVARVTAETERVTTSAREQLQAESVRVANIFADLPAKIAALETLAARIPAEAAEATQSFTETRAAAVSELDSVVVAARSTIATAAEEQTVHVRTAAEGAGESLKALARDLEARLKVAAEQPVRPAAAPKAKPAATAEAAPVQLTLGETVVAEPVTNAPAVAESVSGPKPVQSTIAAPVSEPVNATQVNPIEFAGERAYDDLASAMDDALSR